MNWIKTKEQRPPAHVVVLFYDFSDVVLGMYQGGTLIDGVMYDESWLILDRNYETRRAPEYWCPIPEIPR